MSCRTWEKWISDDLDGALSLHKKERLQRHFKSCEACRSYAARLQRLREYANQLVAAEPVSQSHLEELQEGLKPRLAAAARELQGDGSAWKNGRGQRRWTWWALGALAAAAVLLVLVLPHGDRQGPDEVYAFSLEEALTLLSAELGDDWSLEVSFNELLAANFRKTAEIPDEEFHMNPFESPLFWENLTEEELRYIESVIKKEMKS
jgi:predicted anti-sigma-YlaC factor YlaD